MSTLKADTLSNTAGSLSISTDRVAQGTAAAWCAFDGTAGTPSVSGNNYNVASLTDNGTGSYTITFTSAMPSASYCAVVSAGLGTDAGNLNPPATADKLAGSFRVDVENNAGTQADAYVDVVVFR